MVDRREHRGAHPDDRQLFAVTYQPVLQTAQAELSWLLSRGYQIKSALKLVGDRHALRERQRLAISRAACTDAQKIYRAETCLPFTAIRNQELAIDGFNLIITVEACLSGGVLFQCRDGCIRDLSSVHGSYRSVMETEMAIDLIGNALQSQHPQAVVWFLDQPISNSGRLAQKIRESAAAHDWPWIVEVVMNPDREVSNSGKLAISADSVVLDGVSHWVNVMAWLLEHQFPTAWLVDLRETRLEYSCKTSPSDHNHK
ncbi:MAG: DUF434 domain-containing protein [Blastocatellia bacterium]|nr:DUF434 domain-containing protein [Blastocatellia bacterium]